MATYTQDQYNALIAAIAQGVTSVKYGDKQVDYRSLSEMLRVKALMEIDLGFKRPPRKKLIQHTKGFQ